MQRRDPAHSTIIPPGCTRCFEFSRIESIRVFISNLSMHVCALSKDPFVSINYVFFRLFNLYIQNEKINAWFYIRKNRSKKENDIFLRLRFSNKLNSKNFKYKWNWSISNWINYMLYFLYLFSSYNKFYVGLILLIEKLIIKLIPLFTNYTFYCMYNLLIFKIFRENIKQVFLIQCSNYKIRIILNI